MSLFECFKCHCVENTACTSGYWPNKIKNPPAPVLCSECADGRWHGCFPKRHINETSYVAQSDGTLAPPGGWPKVGEVVK